MRAASLAESAISLSRRSLLGAAALCLSACSAPPEPTRTPASDLVTTLNDALSRGDEPVFLAAFGDLPRARALASRWWRNWRALPGVRLTGTPDRLVVAWQAGGAAPVQDALALEARDGRITDARPLGREPLWLEHDLTVTRRQRVMVVADAALPSETASGWATAAEDAVARLDASGLPGAFAWTGGLVVELPATDLAYRGLTREIPDADVAAGLTLLPGDGSLPRIVLNPTPTSTFTALDRADLLAHEGVHLAIGRGADAAPVWAVEGFADVVGSSPGGVIQRQRDAVLRRLATRTAVALPTASAFEGDDRTALDEAYALAALAVDAACRRRGRPTFAGWLADWARSNHPTDAQFTAWLREALALRR